MFQSRSPRYPVRFEAVVDDGEQSLSAPVTNLSDSGLFLETTTGLKPGARVRIIPLTSDPGGLSEFEGEVVRTQDPVETGGVRRAPGIAVRFVHLLPPDKDRLRDYCRRALSSGTANDDADDDTRSTQMMPPQTKAAAAKVASIDLKSVPAKTKARAPLLASTTKPGSELASDSVEIGRKKKKAPKKAKAIAPTREDDLVDLSEDASLIAFDDAESTSVKPSFSAELEQSESDFFAKGDSFLDGAPIDDDDSAAVIDASQESVVVRVAAKESNTGAAKIEDGSKIDRQSFLSHDVDSEVGSRVQADASILDDSLGALEREIDAVERSAGFETLDADDTRLMATAETKESNVRHSAKRENTIETKESAVADTENQLGVGDFAGEDNATEAYVYSDQLPKSKTGMFDAFKSIFGQSAVARFSSDGDVDTDDRNADRNDEYGAYEVDSAGDDSKASTAFAIGGHGGESGPGRYDRGIYAGVFGAGMALVLGGVLWSHNAADAQRASLETAVVTAEGEIGRTQVQAVQLAGAVDALAKTQATLTQAIGAPRATGAATVTTIGNGATALVEARFTLDNKSAQALDLNFSRTRVFLKEIPTRAPGQAPMAIAGPLEKGAKGWIEIVDDASRKSKPAWAQFKLNRSTKKRLGKANSGLDAVAAGDVVTHEGRWALTAGKPAVVAVVHQWFYAPKADAPTSDDDTGAKKAGRVESTTTMVGLPSAK